MRSRVSLATVALFCLLFAGCGQSSPAEQVAATAPTDQAELERLAKQEGEVVWYTRNLPATVDGISKAFHDRYGITVTNGMSTGTDLAQTVQADLRATGAIGADALNTSDYALLQSLRADSELQALTADRFGITDQFMIDDLGPVCQMLLDTRLKGQVMVNDPRSAAVWQQAWSSVLNGVGLGEDYLKALAAQDIQPVASPLVAMEQLVAGQGSVAVFGIPGLYTKPIAERAPVRYFFPESPSPAGTNICAVPQGAPHPNAGLLFTQWLMSTEGQTILNASEMSGSPLGDLPGAVPRPASYTKPAPAEQVRAELQRIVELLGLS